MSASILKSLMVAGDDYVFICTEFTGAGSGAPTGETGKGVVITRTGTGAYLATFTDAYASLVAQGYGLKASTPVDIAGHTVVFDDLSTTQAFTLYNASDAAHDLAVVEVISLWWIFRKTAY